VVAHAQLVDDADLDRFAALGVIPNMQPLWAQLDPLMVELTIPRLGPDRSDKQYRMHSLDESGAPLAFGSDWPVSSGAPLDGIAVAVSRGGWTPQEILTVERALSAYTAGVAKQAFAEGQWGTIAPGARRPGVVGLRSACDAAERASGCPHPRHVSPRRLCLHRAVDGVQHVGARVVRERVQRLVDGDGLRARGCGRQAKKEERRADDCGAH
jgi:Amidohydrolase family